MDKGTIIYIGGFELPDKNAAAHRVLANGKILKEIGYNVVFIDVDKESAYDRQIITKRKWVQGVEYWSLAYPKLNRQWISYICNIDSFKEIIKIYTNVKVVICYNYQSIAFMKIKKYCNKNNIKIIADCTEWYGTSGVNIIFKIIKSFDSFLRMRIIQKRLDGLIVISKYLKDYYSKCKNVIIIPPLVDLKEEKWNLVVPKNEDNKLRLVYAGSPGKNKDMLNLLVEVLYEMKELSNYIFYVVGVTKGQYLLNHEEQNDIINKLNERIVFLGRVPHRESLNQVKMSDFSVLIRENIKLTNAGFPTKFVESIACGTPVIATKTSDLENYITEGENGFFIDINDKERTISFLNRVLRMNREDIEAMKKNCSKSKVFHYENYIDKVKQFFNNIETSKTCK